MSRSTCATSGRPRLSCLAATFAAALLASSATPALGLQAADTVDVRTPAPTLSAGDRVELQVWRRPELSGEFPVTAEGFLAHPLYKDVQVARVPLPEVERRLRSYLSRMETDPQLVVVPLLSVAVGGEVRRPDLYHLPYATTLAQAVTLAGGPTERADLTELELVRDGRIRELDLRDPDGLAVELRVRSGDKLAVGRRSDWSFWQDLFLPVMATASTTVTIINIATR